MVWARRTRISLLATLLLAAAVLSWLASHPGLYSAQIGRLLTTNLLRESGATFSCRDLEGNPLSRMVFRGVTVTREGDDGSFLYLTADSLVVGYDLRSVWSRRTQLEEFIIGGVDILLRKGALVDGAGEESTRPRAGRLPPEMRVRHLALLRIDATITEADGELVHEFRDLTVELAAEAAGDGVDALLTRAEVDWVTQDVRLHRAIGRVRLAPPVYQFSSMQVETDSIRATADAYLRAETGLDSLWIEGSATDFELNELLRAMGKDGDGPRLVATGSATVTKSGDAVRIEARGEGLLEDASVRGDEFVAVLENDVLRFERIRGRYRSAEGEVTGRVRLKPVPRLELEGEVSGVDASDPWAAGEDLGWPASDLAGHARLGLDLGDSIRLDLELSELWGEAATLPVEDGLAIATWSESAGLELTEARLRSHGTLLAAYGTISPRDQVVLRVTAFADSLAPWAREVLLPIEGEGAELSGTLTGTLDSLRLSARGQVRQARALGVTVEESQVQVRIPRVVRQPGDIELELFSPRLSLYGRPQGAASVALRRREPWIRVDRLALARSDSDLVARGTIREHPDGLFEVQLDTLGTSWGNDRWQLVQGDRFEVADGYFHTEGLAFESEVGRVSVNGGVRRPGLMDLRLDVQGGDLNLLDRLDFLKGIEGGLDGRFEFSGTLDSTSFVVDATVDTLVLPGRQIHGARLVGRAEGGHLEIDVLELDSGSGGGGLNGTVEFGRADWLRAAITGEAPVRTIWRGAVLDLDLRPRSLDIARWADPRREAGLYGLLTADLRVAGPTQAPVVRGTARLRNYPAPPFFFPSISGELSVDAEGVRLENGRLDLGGRDATVRARLPLIVSLTDSVRFEREKGVEVEFHSPKDMDLAGLPAIWPDLRRTAGRGTVSFVATGDPTAPDLEGTVTIRDGVVQLRSWSEWLRELEIDGKFSGRALDLTRIQAREGAKGRIDATGTVGFKGLLPDDVSLKIDAERVLISSVPDLKAIASGKGLRLRLAQPSPGAPRAPLITGSLLVDKAVYTGSFEADPASGTAGLGPNASPPWMARLRIRMQDAVRISMDFAELRVAGDVDFIRDTQGIRIRGQAEIPSGRVSLIGTEFKITEGDLDFSRSPVEPEIDLVARTEVPVYDTVGATGRTLEEITLQMRGTLAEPEITFTSKSGFDDASILRLLAGLQPTDTTGSSNAMGTLGMRAGFSVLERALSQEMSGIDTFEIVTNESAANDVTNTRIAFGKYLTESVYLRYAQGFSAGERDILLEYQMSRRTLFSGELKSRISEVGTEDEFNVDFKWRIRY